MEFIEEFSPFIYGVALASGAFSVLVGAFVIAVVVGAGSKARAIDSACTADGDSAAIGSENVSGEVGCATFVSGPPAFLRGVVQTDA